MRAMHGDPDGKSYRPFPCAVSKWYFDLLLGSLLCEESTLRAFALVSVPRAANRQMRMSDF